MHTPASKIAEGIISLGLELSELLRGIDLTRPLTEIMRPMMEQGITFSGSDAAAIVLYDVANQHPGILQLITFQLSAGFISNFHLYPDGLTNEILLGNDFIICNDAGKIHGLRQLDRDEGIRSFICLPLCALGRKLGLAYVYNKNKDDFSELEIVLLQMYGSMLSHLVANSLVIAEAKSSQDGQMSAVNQMTASLAHEINNPLAFVIANLQGLDHYFAMVSVLLEKYHRLLCRAVPVNIDSALWDAQTEISKSECDACQFLVSREVPRMLRETLNGAEHIRDVVRMLLSAPSNVKERLY